ncbi:tetratricopeptide repeat protein [Phormidium yuhuli AB48]|uniref:Tetratricopeptide repeat protein n=1 Tax=Phormidium yuhuli AB48 TaxID=2940671 RepID=A0ABY5AN79_9CYAN|nr:tetratricopeptide repeat protein [Phormidium yuhuli]USR90292.1 tetratricopeptide repeat protein [Phormidium yuhuli AB48]
MSILLVSTLQTKLDRLQAKIKHKGIVLELVFRKTGVRLNPQNPWSHYHLAKCFLKLKRWQDAEVVYRKTLELNPEIALAHHELGDILQKKKQWSDAVECYQQAIHHNDQFSWSFHNLGDALKELGQWHEAADAYRQAAERNPDFFATHSHLADVLMRLQDWQGAVAAYRQGLRLNGQDFESLYNLAAALEQLGDRPAVADTYLKLIPLKPDFPWYYYSFFWKTLQAENRLTEAETAYKQALNLDSTNIEIYINLGDTLIHQKRISDSLPYYEKALDIKLSRHYPSLLEERTNTPSFQCKANRLDFIILGAQKAGTSSLYAYMAHHPDIVPALRKEVEFWSWKFYRGLDWYFAHFPQIPEGSHLQTGEACPGYLDFYETAERLREALPNIKLIILLRNPVDRAISHYHHWVRRNQESLGLEEAIEAKFHEIEEKGRVWRIHSNYIARGVYVEFIKHWFSIFPREQFLILKSEDFYENPGQSLDKVYEFIGLPTYQLSSYKKYNSGQYSPAEVSVRQKIAEFYKPYNQELSQLLDADFTWEK